MSSAQNLEDPKKDAINNKLSKRMIFSYFATFALGMVASQALLQTSSNQGMNQESVLNQSIIEMNESKFLQKLWMSNQFQNFTWNTTRDIDYNQTGDGFSDIFVSPTGEIFGVQTVIIPEQRVSRAFRYNPNWDMWNDVFYNFNTKKIRFDSEGNFYLIDQNNTLYAKNSQDEVLLPCVQDVAPSSNGTVFVIQYENYDCQYNQSQYNFSNSSNTTDIQVYSASYYKKIVIFYGQPVFITVNNTLEKFFFYFQKDSHCLSDISVASDGTLWGINCTYFNSNMVQTGSLTKWNNQTANFDDVYNITAQRVEAYNEISVALLKDGRISYSTPPSNIQIVSPHFLIYDILISNQNCSHSKYKCNKYRNNSNNNQKKLIYNTKHQFNFLLNKRSFISKRLMQNIIISQQIYFFSAVAPTLSKDNYYIKLYLFYIFSILYSPKYYNQSLIIIFLNLFYQFI